MPKPALVFEVDQKPGGLPLEAGLDRQVAGPFPSVDGNPFLIDEFQHFEIDESAGLGQESVEESPLSFAGAAPRSDF